VGPGNLLVVFHPTACATRCTIQGKWLEIVLRCIHGFCDSRELFPRYQQASDVTKITGEAASHHTTCLLSSRCAIRGTVEEPEAVNVAITNFLGSLS
jgi:hypothetical protein